MCRCDDYGKKDGVDELYGVGHNVGVKLRKWEKYMPVGGMIQVKRFKKLIKKCNYYHVNKIQGYLYVTVSIFIYKFYNVFS